MHDPERLVLDEARQTLWLQFALDLERTLASVDFRQRVGQIAITHQDDLDVGLLARAGGGDVEVLHAGPDVCDCGDNFGPAVRLGAIVDEDAYRPVELANAVGRPAHVKLGAERDLEEAFDDLGVGEGLALDRAPPLDLGMFGLREDGGGSREYESGGQYRSKPCAARTIGRYHAVRPAVTPGCCVWECRSGPRGSSERP